MLLCSRRLCHFTARCAILREGFHTTKQYLIKSVVVIHIGEHGCRHTLTTQLTSFHRVCFAQLSSFQQNTLWRHMPVLLWAQ